MLKSNLSRQAAVIMPNRSSVTGYLAGMLSPQYLHLPFEASQLTSGIRSLKPSTCPQLVQWLRPLSTDSP